MNKNQKSNVNEGIITTYCSATGGNSNQYNSKAKRLETFSSRYALPTNDPSLIAKLPFTFGYRFTDDYGTMQSREEKTDPNGSKTGSYSFVDASGTYRRVDYIADVHGFRATVRTNEPGIYPENPAHVRVRIEDNKNVLPSPPNQQNIRNAPQLEYSSHIFSRYNFSNSNDQSNIGLVKNRQNFGYANKNSVPNNREFFGGNAPRRPGPLNEPVFAKNVNYYKGSPFPDRQPLKTMLLSEFDLSDPVTYPDSQRLNPKEFFNGPAIDPDFVFDDKIANSEYDNGPGFSLISNPTRYPRRLRDSRTRSKQRAIQYKIHIPRGYENYPNLPLYRDK
ncbi:adult-specific rigid cuticular protein 15.5 [Trichonephila clavata]|uniref:Adult-specific rigid cuticular protein 15.5 n=1 Tax=Trichonephila clavata TaxID=2740835 RepID=A0A8X6JL06_TRICU|nr:adult-specific rigid cuticular protein 15.5 [Trichonephila clavata]